MSSLCLECREHCQSVHEELPVAERQEDGKPVSDPALGILRATCLDGQLGEVEKPPALPPGEAHLSGNLD